MKDELRNENKKFTKIYSAAAIFIDYCCKYLKVLFGGIVAKWSKHDFELLF
jgi:hypothetical protein